MGLIIAILAVIGLATVVNLGVRWHQRRPSAEPTPEVDLAAPYREGLHAAMQLQSLAHDAERQLLIAALRHRGTDGGDPPPAGVRR